MDKNCFDQFYCVDWNYAEEVEEMLDPLGIQNPNLNEEVKEYYRKRNQEDR
jgi:hypothetical protein